MNILQNNNTSLNFSSLTWNIKKKKNAHNVAERRHTLYDNSIPVARIVCDKNDKVKYIRGQKQQEYISPEYASAIKSYIFANNMQNSSKSIEAIDNLEANKIDAEIIKSEIKDFVENEDYDKILKFFNISVKKEKDKKILSNYSQPAKNLTFSDLGIDESKLFKNVIKIKGNADFSNSSLTSTQDLVFVGGDVTFNSSEITDTKNLEIVLGDVNFAHSKVKNTGKLKHILGNVNFQDSSLNTTGNIEFVGKNANFRNSKVSEIPELRYVGGKILFINSPLNKKSFSNVIKK